jgi:hypothetical protein
LSLLCLDAIKGAAAMPDEIRDYFIRSNVFLRITSEEQAMSG